jgi:hypothetical protein
VIGTRFAPGLVALALFAAGAGLYFIEGGPADVTADEVAARSLHPIASAPISRAALEAADLAPVQAGAVGTTLHKNYFYLYGATYPAPSVNISFAWTNGFLVTDGQPFNGVTVTNPSDATNGFVVIEVAAGRHPSEKVANAFNADAPINDGGDSWFADRPKELNFFITGTLTINNVAHPVIIGQGGDWTSNNWWVGGSAPLRKSFYGLQFPVGQSPDPVWTLCPAGSDSSYVVQVVHTPQENTCENIPVTPPIG